MTWRKVFITTQIQGDAAKKPGLKTLFAFFSSFVSGFGGDEGGSDDHSDKGEGDQEIMHFEFLLGCGFFRACPHLDDPSNAIFVKSHKDGSCREAGGMGLYTKVG